ncbi:hypothetical protein F511_17700 [Dorcoceras hygrometricum]|uniref:Uncharacterized protein n=1 Tax=Dorcoceras hygrometricum TaxID=472368 RepID=A0A2Z7B169_9LAMI|nr:hypothetical protein F511_17700 [Dorcoceras hygrometricum]
MDQENKQETQRLLTRRMEPSWFSTNQLDLKKAREKTGSGDLVKLERRRKKSVIVNNVDAYDDVKITCRPIPKEFWRNIPVVKEVTSREGNQLDKKNKSKLEDQLKSR